MDAFAEQALDALAAAGRRAAEERDLGEALRVLGAALAEAVEADAVVIRLPDGAGQLAAGTVVARSEVLAAELEGSSFPLAELPPGESAGDELPVAVRRAAQRSGAADVLLMPAGAADDPLGSLELMRSRPFTPHELSLARVAASHLALVLRAFNEANGADRGRVSSTRALALAGDALAAGLGQARAADEIVRIAAGAAGAEAALLWRLEGLSVTKLVASTGSPEAPLDAAARAAERALAEQQPVMIDRDGAGPDRSLATVPVGQPPLGVLQLVFSAEASPSRSDLERLATFAVRAAQALRAGERTREISLELERTQALLRIVGQATAHLSLSHTLETAVARVSELLRADSVAVYLRDQDRLHTAARRGLGGAADLAVAEELLELALGPQRAQGMLHVSDAAADIHLSRVRDEVRESEIEAVLAVPLVAHEELIGLLAVYLPRGRELTGNESTLLAALASQLAVAVENARLHERTKRLGSDLEQALDAERQAARRLGALYEISRSFAQSLSLDETLAAVARTAVELLDADAAVIRTPDEQGESLVPAGFHAADDRLAGPLEPLLKREQPLEKLPGRRLFRMGKPLILDPASARRLGASYELLVPFLEQGSTAVVVPVASPVELLATLTVVSLDPDRRIGAGETATAVYIAGQAALAIDNARLYQQKKDFADTMQRSLLPRGLPEVAGLDVGAVYESSSRRVEVGGDVYDFLTLPDGRLAVVLGDVVGHGIAATAEMALAKFVFRSLIRQYPDPGQLLAQANEVVLLEVAAGSFITMACLVVDPERGELRAASAGHPPARLIAADGTISPLVAEGLALGVEPSQEYVEARLPLPPGAAVCLYTDGLIEARRDGEEYGAERLDAALVAGRGLPAQALAERVVADCRAFAGEPADDFAVVVLRRVAEASLAMPLGGQAGFAGLTV